MRQSLWPLATFFVATTCLATSIQIPSEDKNKTQKDLVTIESINSPVHESFAKFRITSPEGIASNQVFFEVSGNPGIKRQAVDLKQTSQGWEGQIQVSSLPPGTFELHAELQPKRTWLDKALGILQLRESKDLDNGILQGTAQFVIDPSLEVADPGEAGKKTLEGIDSDYDGIRDDVQRWINETYANSPRTKAAMKQLARDQQTDLLAASDKDASITAGHKYLNSYECLCYVKGLAEAVRLSHALTAKVLNTDARHRANIKANANFHGQTRRVTDPADDKKKCGFDPDSLAQ